MRQQCPNPESLTEEQGMIAVEALQSRFNDSVRLEIFHDSPGKHVAHYQEVDGRDFVLRTYAGPVRDIVRSRRTTLREAHGIFTSAHRNAGIHVANASVLPGSVYPSGTAIISEFIPGTRPFAAARLSSKIQLAKSLPTLMMQKGPAGQRISYEAIQPDTFLTAGQGDDERVVVVDVDPYVFTPTGQFGEASYHAGFTRKCAEVLWDTTSGDQRQKVMLAYVDECSLLIDELGPNADDLYFKAFADVHLMSNDIDFRTLPSHQS